MSQLNCFFLLQSLLLHWLKIMVSSSWRQHLAKMQMQIGFLSVSFDFVTCCQPQSKLFHLVAVAFT